MYCLISFWVIIILCVIINDSKLLLSNIESISMYYLTDLKTLSTEMLCERLFVFWFNREAEAAEKLKGFGAFGGIKFNLLVKSMNKFTILQYRSVYMIQRSITFQLRKMKPPRPLSPGAMKWRLTVHPVFRIPRTLKKNSYIVAIMSIRKAN